MIPPVFQFVLMFLVAYRVWRLLSEDDILERPRKWVVRLPLNWEEGDPIPKEYRAELAAFINCPWCLGFWVSGIVYAVWLSTLGESPSSVEDVAVGLGIWLALSACVGLVRSYLDPPE